MISLIPHMVVGSGVERREVGVGGIHQTGRYTLDCCPDKNEATMRHCMGLTIRYRRYSVYIPTIRLSKLLHDLLIVYYRKVTG